MIDRAHCPITSNRRHCSDCGHPDPRIPSPMFDYIEVFLQPESPPLRVRLPLGGSVPAGLDHERGSGKRMALTLFELDAHLGRMAATDVDGFVEGGVFFPDFSCPLKIMRNFGLIAESVFAPVIHEGKRQGAYVVGVHRSEPCARGAVR